MARQHADAALLTTLPPGVYSVQVGGDTGVALAAILNLSIHQWLSAEEIAAWGWRIGFLAGGVLGLVSFFLRLSLEESREFSRIRKVAGASAVPVAEVVRKYPSSEYATNAKRKIEIARDQLAGKEMMIGRSYLESKNFTGAINRFKIVVTQYQTTRHVEEALMRLTEAYLALGVTNEAQTAAAVLGHNFPDSRWYADAYRLGGYQLWMGHHSWTERGTGEQFVDAAVQLLNELYSQE